MKKFLAPLVLAAGLPCVVSAADVQVYGKGNVSLQHADETGDSKVELVSNNSRIGVKGSEALTEGLEAFFQFEYETSIDDGDDGGQTFSQRDIFVGLRGNAGALLVGRMNTPLKNAQGKVDLFNDLEGDIAYLLAGENRRSNQVQYRSPVIGEYFSGSVAYITYEEDGVDPGISAAAGYTQGPLYLAVGMDQDVAGPDADVVRLVARYSLGVIHIGALLETYDDGLVDEDGALASVLWNLNERWNLKAQAGSSDINNGGGESVSLGADYRLSDSTKLFGYYTSETNDLGCGGVGCDDEYLGVGMELKF
ncbi:porin [Marinimicrobium agarilyticum]|uniref:porin n=1 Tax=Marinimicrobium agarilyticum TaxID=306546 RepID=UPI00041FD7F1|nr:porin [Marinimicrobium agarilyticum]